MATIKEQDIVLVSKEPDGTKVIQMPITRVENVEGAIKTINGNRPDISGNVSISNITSATNANYATTAGSATKASQDGNGNTITTTYAEKAELNTGLASKANKTHSHTISDVPKATTIEAETGTLDTKVMTPAATKAAILKLAPSPDLSAYATKTELTNGLAGKQPTGNYALADSLARVATSGNYNDLLGRPSIPSAPHAYLVGSWRSGANWWRKWSDGFIEQGGRQGSNPTVNLHHHFTSTEYNVQLTFANKESTQAIDASGAKTTSYFTWHRYSGIGGYEAYWYACGF